VLAEMMLRSKHEFGTANDVQKFCLNCVLLQQEQ